MLHTWKDAFIIALNIKPSGRTTNILTKLSYEVCYSCLVIILLLITRNYQKLSKILLCFFWINLSPYYPLSPLHSSFILSLIHLKMLIEPTYMHERILVNAFVTPMVRLKHTFRHKCANVCHQKVMEVKILIP